MYNYFCDFEKNFYPLVKAQRIILNNLNVDMRNVCGDNPFYYSDIGLFYPLISDTTVLGYIAAPIQKGQLAKLEVLDAANVKKLSEANILRLLPQTIKALNTVSMGSRMCSRAFSQNYNHGEISIKIRTSEIIKAVTLGYLEFPKDTQLLDVLTEVNYEIGSLLKQNKGAPLQAKSKAVYNFINGHSWGEWLNKQVGSSIGKNLVRSNKAFDQADEIKWRKPSKNSVWPYTLDHHWFMVQESPITLANYTFKALLQGSDNSNRKKDKIDAQYPIFSKPYTVECGRKLLEIFFVDVLTKKSKSQWGQIVHMTDNMRWVSDNPCYLIPKLCLALGVVPRFDESGTFTKFFPINGNLKQPSKKLYVEINSINIDQNNKLEPFIATIMSLCYDLGLVPLDAIEKNLGVINAGEALKHSKDYYKSTLGNNIVCCIPKEFSNNLTNKAIVKLKETLEKQKPTDEPVFN
jgi:hypothetical protein